MVLRRAALRRWLVVLAAVGLLSSLPAAVKAWPADHPQVAADVLRERILRSGELSYQGYAESAGALGLPELPRLNQIATLLSSNTRMRAWYSTKDQWRVDVVDT